MAILKKFVHIVGKIFYIGTFVIIGIIVFILLLFIFIIPMATDITAANLTNDIKRLPLPDGAELIDSVSLAANFAGTGNATDIFGAILIKSELTLDELQEHYSQYPTADNRRYSVEVQTTERINVIHGQFKFKIKGKTAPLTNHFIVYAFAEPPEFLRIFDFRGN